MTVTSRKLRQDSTLRFNFAFAVSGADSRPCPYSGGDYLPDTLYFSLVSQGHDERLPRYKDLAVDDVSLSGLRLKKDGKPGTLRKNEIFYSFMTPAPWMAEIIEKTALALREQAAW